MTILFAVVNRVIATATLIAVIFVLSSNTLQGLSTHSINASTTSKHRPVTVDDLIRQEDLGQASIDPTGSWLAFVRIPPFYTLPDYSIGRPPGAKLPAFGEIMVINLTKSEGPKPLFAKEPETEYRLQSFSPDGKRLALYALRKGRASLEIYDFPGKRLRVFKKECPEIILDYEDPAVWISADEIVYAALPEGRQPMMTSFRRYTGERLFEAWNKAWKGKEPSGTEVHSRADGGGKELRDGRLLKANARTGLTELLTTGAFKELRASSHTRFIAGLRQAEAAQPLPDRILDYELVGRFQLVLLDLETRKNHVVAPEMYILDGSLSWAPTKDELAFFGWSKDGSRREGMFYTYDARTEKLTAWPHSGLDLADPAFQRPARAAWFNGKIAVLARANAKGDNTAHFNYRGVGSAGTFGKADWFLLNPTSQSQNLTADFSAVSPLPVNVTAQGICLLADGNVWSLNHDGTKTNLTGSFGGNLVPATFAGRPKVPYPTIAFVRREDGRSKYLLLDTTVEGGAISVTPPSERVNLLTGSARAGIALFRENSNEGTRILLQRADGATTEVSRLNQYIANVSKPEWRTISYRVNGEELESGVLLPYNFEPAKRYPVIVDIYPGRSFVSGPPVGIGEHVWFYSLELLTAKGYIVFRVANPRKLNRTETGPIAGMADVVQQGIDALVAKGYADNNRISLLGVSQGGFSALWLATETDRFRAVASINGWADMASHYFEGGIYRAFYSDQDPFTGSIGRYEPLAGGDFNLGYTPWQDVDVYNRNSPIYRADRIRTPIMLIHSDMDGFSINQYEMMFTALYRLRKEARLVRYWGEGHGPSSPANIRDFWYRTFAWFDEWSDISRDQQGNLVWDGEKVKSRNGAAPLKAEDFARFDQMILKNSQ